MELNQPPLHTTNKYAIIILHEIYGVNQFIKDVCQKFQTSGFDVICPNLIKRNAFLYEQSQEAYQFYMNNVGFEAYKKINQILAQLKTVYEKVYILGFSAGATNAFRCCDNSLCDGIIACYGSRIRDYIDLTPSCPTLLLFANESSFDINVLLSQLKKKPNLQIHLFHANHGFLDPYSISYDSSASRLAESLITNFICNKPTS